MKKRARSSPPKRPPIRQKQAEVAQGNAVFPASSVQNSLAATKQESADDAAATAALRRAEAQEEVAKRVEKLQKEIKSQPAPAATLRRRRPLPPR